MAFVLPSDPAFVRAKEAMRGKLGLSRSFALLAHRIENRYQVRPLWLETDTPKNSAKLRLSVILGRKVDYRCFVHEWNFDPKKQRVIADMYREVVADTRRPSLFARSRTSAEDEIFVCFDDFERVATMEAHQSVTQDEMWGFEAGLGLGERFWTTSQYAGPPVVFVHTDAQVEELKASPLRDRWADDYFAIVQPHDEFAFVQRADISITVDSKARFDSDYSSNWYYYWK